LTEFIAQISHLKSFQVKLNESGTKYEQISADKSV